ncbi:MAG: hypothetical protein HFG31_03120 [Eubacterium sp.]|nr:hypothetical protein [Eubacterium sp.]
MSRKGRNISIITIMLLFVMSISILNIKYVKGASTFTKLEIEDMQLNKARIKTGSGDSAGKHVEVYWQQDKLDSFDKLTDITFARTVLHAEEAGDYTLQIHAKNESGSDSITIRMFVNGTTYDVVLTGNGYTTLNKTVSFKKGNNTVILAWVNWGYFDYLNIPEGVTVVRQSDENKYYAFEAALNEVQLAPTSVLHNSAATLYTAPIEYNSGDEEWQGSVSFTVKAAADIKSINLGYYVSSYNNGKAQLAMSVNGGKETVIDVSGTKINTELVKSISTKILAAAGFKVGRENTIKFRQASASGGKVGLHYIELKKDDIEEITTVQHNKNRYEAENAYVIAGGKIKQSESDDEAWSKKEYVGEFTSASIQKPSQIDEYCSNIGYIQYKVTAQKTGIFKVTLGYATEKANMPVYVTSGYEWSKINLISTESWNNIGEASTYVYLKKGINYIWVTGPSTTEDWVNYDYIDVEFEQEGTVNTKKTVLFMDNGVSGKAVKVEEETTSAEEKTTLSDEKNDDGVEEEEKNNSLKSPQTGITMIFITILMLISICVMLVAQKKEKCK